MSRRLLDFRHCLAVHHRAAREYARFSNSKMEHSITYVGACSPLRASPLPMANVIALKEVFEVATELTDEQVELAADVEPILTDDAHLYRVLSKHLSTSSIPQRFYATARRCSPPFSLGISDAG
jgi:hypothetical protein